MIAQPETQERLIICPFCGGRIIRCEFSDAGGVRKFSLCCDAPTEVIDNWDVFSGLPAVLQQAALDRIKADYAEMSRKSKENARLFKENADRWMRRRPDLFHGVKQLIPMHE